MRGLIACIATAVIVTSAAAQASPYLPLDDPRLPLLEHLITRGAVKDPTPQVRPLLLGDALKALRAAAVDSTASGAAAIRALLRAWELPPSEAWWRVAPRAGLQGFSQGRRDLLQPGGSGSVKPYADASLLLSLGPVLVAARPALEDRLRDDPDYRPVEPARQFKQYWRVIEGYLLARWKWGGVHFGQVDRNWGPAGLSGIPIGNDGYPRTDFDFWIGNRSIRFESVRALLQDEVDDSGVVVTRWFAAHRLNVRITEGLDLAIWESAVAARRGGSIDPAILNPFVLMAFGSQWGIGDRRNPMLGGDLTWRPSRRLVLQAQGAIDDWTFTESNPYPNRFGLTLGGAGALGRSLSWSASYAMNSSLAYHALNPHESFTDKGVGIGRNFIDNDRIAVSIGVPVRGHWLVTPQVQLLRQGEGRIDDAFPDPEAAAALPVLFIGTRQDTWQLAIGVNGQERGIAVSGLGGIQRVTNAGHVAGARETRVVGRIQATIGFRVGGALRAEP